MDSLKRLYPIFGMLALLLPLRLSAQTPEPVVHAVLFYHPTCPHCHELITQYLIPLQEKHGDAVVILGMDTSREWANNLYWEAISYYEVPEEDWAVPMLVVGEEAFVGGDRIPLALGPILESGLAGDGVDLPSFPALVTFLRAQDALDPRYPDRLIARRAPPAEGAQPSGEPEQAVPEGTPEEGDTAAGAGPEIRDTSGAGVPAGAEEAGVPGEAGGRPPDSAVRGAQPEPRLGESVSDEAQRTPLPEGAAPASAGEGGMVGLQEAAQELESMTMGDRFKLDPAGNSLSVLVLIGMVVSLILRGYPPRVKGGPWPPWVIPGLVLLGAAVAAYLSYIEVTQAQAVCGPVGDCNTVNQSEYATLFGFLPVGVLGLLGYGGMLVLWVLRHSAAGRMPRWATLGLWAAALLGTLFSVYLTFLEPFVIGATCAWCLTSAVVMTLLLWATAPGAAGVWTAGEKTTAS